MSLTPLTFPQAHRLLLQPLEEGCERLTRAWQGVNFHTISLTPLCWQERVVSLLTGSVLLIPVVSHLFWIAWNIGGLPEQLADL